MGRRPNPLILEFFERGAKLNDNSNRYHHRCKACGEDFPKGRIDTLVTHLTKKCPAISEANRINACLALHGFDGASRPRYDGLLHSGPNMGPGSSNAGGLSMAHTSQPQNFHSNNSNVHHHIDHTQGQAQNEIWAPLETLAEVSRQFEAKEKHDGQLSVTADDPSTNAVQTTLAAAIPSIPTTATHHLELQEQFTLENPPLSYNDQAQQEKRDSNSQKQSEFVHQELSTEEQRVQQLLQAAASPRQTALSVAAAATARLTSSILDDAAIAQQVVQAAPSAEVMINYHEPERVPINQIPHATPPPPEASTPWGGMTYMAGDIHAPATVAGHGHQPGPVLNKGGYRMDTVSSPNGPHRRHRRARFNSDRRMEVQEVRRIGACIRCRILRKVCSKGTPCDTCKKVLSPRIWRTGCVRTKLSESIDLYSAGVQVVMAQKRINGYKTAYHLENTGAIVEASHFHETGHSVSFQVLQGYLRETDGSASKIGSHIPIILLDIDREDIPGKVESYMRTMLPEYIAHEPSPHIRLTLEISDRIAKDTNDELLKRSLELWGIVEMMDRERQWTMLAKYPESEVEDHWIKDDAESDAYSNICMQLTAAAERKACVASKNLLNGIQRILQDGKTNVGFPMFLTIMLFLNCLEKTTWAFKAWDQENLRPKWPLERPPGSYTNQGHGVTDLLRMLLSIRHILPKIIQSDPDMPITTEVEDPIVQRYFHLLNVTPHYLQMRCSEHNFQPTDSRSLEFLFCAQLLLDAPMPQSEIQAIPMGPIETPHAPPRQMAHIPPHDMPEAHPPEIIHTAPHDLPEANTQQAAPRISEDMTGATPQDPQEMTEANPEEPHVMTGLNPQEVVHETPHNTPEVNSQEVAHSATHDVPEANTQEISENA